MCATLHGHQNGVVDVGLRDVGALAHHDAAEAVEVGDLAHLRAALRRGVGAARHGAHALAQLVDTARLLRRCNREAQRHHQAHNSDHLHLCHLGLSNPVDQPNRTVPKRRLKRTAMR